MKDVLIINSSGLHGLNQKTQTSALCNLELQKMYKEINITFKW